VEKALWNIDGINAPRSMNIATYPANHQRGCGGRRNVIFGYRREQPKRKMPDFLASEEAPGINSKSTASKGNVKTNSKKAQRRIIGVLIDGAFR
jgi:hypothetical protein